MKRKLIFSIFAAFAAVIFLPAFASAQANQLMLADILIALRSKKASLSERNDIIAKAVATRGITFALTPEIEKELSDTGADRTLIDSIRQHSGGARAAAITPAESKPTPVEPPPPDFTFFQKRGDAALAKGEFDLAIAEYSSSIEKNSTWIGSYLGRAAALSGKGLIEEAIKDYDKVIELKPESSLAHFKRAELTERAGDVDRSLAFYTKAYELDAGNSAAKTAAERIVAARTKAAEKVERPQPERGDVQTAPEFVDLGPLGKQQATSLATPIYPASLSRTSLGGRVIVEVVFDATGKVISAKATSGSAFLKQSAETAALRSKFRPAMVNGVPVKGRGYIAYNFEAGR